MKFLVLIENDAGNIKRLTVSDTSQTCCMQRIKAWAKEHGLGSVDISVIPMTKGCYTPGALESYRISQ